MLKNRASFSLQKTLENQFVSFFCDFETKFKNLEKKL